MSTELKYVDVDLFSAFLSTLEQSSINICAFSNVIFLSLSKNLNSGLSFDADQ